LDEVSPWGRDQPTLHWFGLTEGWYWIEADGHQLLRWTRPDGPHPYVDYYLARLWEEHEDRAHWLARSLDRSPATDWDIVRQGARLLAAGGLQDDASTA
jgi:hypothetical protein